MNTVTPYQKQVISTLLANMVPPTHRFAVIIIPVREENPTNAETTVMDNCGSEPLQRRQLANVLRNTADTFDPHGKRS